MGMHTQIFQCIIHPAQIPFIIEAQSAILRRSRYLDIIGGILCHQHDLGIGLLQIEIGIAQEPTSRCIVIELSRLTIFIN